MPSFFERFRGERPEQSPEAQPTKEELFSGIRSEQEHQRQLKEWAASPEGVRADQTEIQKSQNLLDQKMNQLERLYGPDALRELGQNEGEQMDKAA